MRTTTRLAPLPLAVPAALTLGLSLPLDLPANDDAPTRSGTGAPDRILIGAGFLPEYDGADRAAAVPIVAVRLHRDRRYVAFEGTALFANLVDRTNLEAGPYARYAFGRDDSVDSAAVGALEDIDPSVELGGFVSWSTASAALGGSTVNVESTLTADASGVHDGWQASFGASLERSLGARLGVVVGVSLDTGSEDYVDTYFSISDVEATASGLAPFDADGGLVGYGIDLGARYALNPRLFANAFLAQRRLVGDVADSPIVSIEGSANSLSGGVGLGWLF